MTARTGLIVPSSGHPQDSGFALGEVAERVDRSAVDAYLEMEMRSGTEAGAAGDLDHGNARAEQIVLTLDESEPAAIAEAQIFSPLAGARGW